MTKRLTNLELLDVFRKRFPSNILEYRPATDSWRYEKIAITVGDLSKRVAFRLDVASARVVQLLAEVSAQRRAEASSSAYDLVMSQEKNPIDERPLAQFLSLVCCDQKRDAVTREADMVAIKQLMWCVKRNVVQQPASWQVVPIFYSRAHGTGKSYNIKRLISPFEDFTRHVNVNELGEKFSGALWANTRIVFFDEFDGVEKNKVAQFKAILTGKPIDQRSMHSESGFYAENRLVCIGTSNLPPPHGFIDTSGMRRLWSIQCSSEVADVASSRIRELDKLMDDPSLLWQAVHYHQPPPQAMCSPDVRLRMAQVRHETLRTKTSLENFCDDRLERLPGFKMPLKEFQHHYKTYCSVTQQRALRGGYAAITEQLETLGKVVKRPCNVYYLLDYRIIDEEMV